MLQSLQKLVESIPMVDRSLTPAVQTRLDDLTKPKGSLGRLEEILMHFAVATGSSEPVLTKKKIFCMAADHGVAAEGVSAYPAVVTPQMVFNMLGGGAAINVLSRHAGADLKVVDMGVAHVFEPHSLLHSCKVRQGSSNMAEGPAMTEAEALQAILAGAELAILAAEAGYHLLGTGEMGIANTTPAAALCAVLLDLPVDAVTGRGTGIDDASLHRKIGVIRTAIEINRERLGTPLGTLAALGGFEIAGLCGLMLGAASLRLPVVVDGFISTAAAVCALAFSERIGDYLFFSHLSDERGHRVVMDRLGLKPILDLGLRLGEGTGAALAMQVIEASVRVYHEMATFGAAGVSGTTK